MAEAYGVAYQNGSYVTTGYGRRGPSPASGQTSPVDMVSFRYGTEGTFDDNYGVDGIFEFDAGFAQDDRGFNILTLPDDLTTAADEGRVVIAGTSTVAPSTSDGLLIVASANGVRDPLFDTDGYKHYAFESTNPRSTDAFYGLALSPNNEWVAAAGYRGGDMTDEDGSLVLLPVGGSGTEVAKTVALSADANDRLWAVTFDSTNRAVAAGFIVEGSDSWMAVARFTTDGNLDPTFGVGGVAKINVVTKTTTSETARGVIVQSNGKIVIGGVAELP